MNRLNRLLSVVVYFSAAFAFQLAYAEQPITVNNVTLSDTMGLRSITGEVVNESNQRLPLVTVQFKLWTADDHYVGVAMDSTRDLDPHKTWVFHAQTNQQFDHVEIVPAP